MSEKIEEKRSGDNKEKEIVPSLTTIIGFSMIIIAASLCIIGIVIFSPKLFIEDPITIQRWSILIWGFAITGFFMMWIHNNK